MISFWMIAAGMIGGLVAAVFGLIDWLSIPSGTRARAVVLSHGLTTFLMVALFATAWLLRAGAPGEPGAVAIVLSFVGVGLASMGGYLGGELVVRMGVGVSEGARTRRARSPDVRLAAARSAGGGWNRGSLKASERS